LVVKVSSEKSKPFPPVAIVSSLPAVPPHPDSAGNAAAVIATGAIADDIR
jgi:hypothetical protein